MRMWSEGYPFMEIVGVVPDVKEQQIAADPMPRMYMPYAQTGTAAYSTPRGLYVAMLTEGGDALAAMPIARRIMGEIDATVPISRVRTLESILAQSLATERFARVLLQIFGVVAVLLACVGVYGVLSISVSQRVPEIGLRKALGASSQQVWRGVMLESAGLALVGGLVGIGLGVFVTRAMEGLLYRVSGSDPLTLVSVVGLIGVTALVAAALPALRASRVDPMVALKGD